MTDSEKLDLLLSELQEVNQRMEKLDSGLQETNQRMEKLDSGLQETNQRMENIESQVTKTELIIENEIRVNIQRVAEGHLDLSRKLNECIRLSNDIKDKQEIQDIYINMHNSKLKAL